MSGQYHALHNALALVGDGSPTPRLDRLYADARRTWLSLGYCDLDLHSLLLVMGRLMVEVDESDNLQLRLAYGIKEAA